MPHCINFTRGQTKLNEGKYCKTCFAQIKNTSVSLDLVIGAEPHEKTINNGMLNELISLGNNRSVLKRSSSSDHGIWPSQTHSPVHESLMEDPENEERNANQGASNISTHSFKSTPR